MGRMWSSPHTGTELSQATRLAMVHERAAPLQTPHSKEVVQSPKGVFVMMEILARDSAIHLV